MVLGLGAILGSAVACSRDPLAVGGGLHDAGMGDLVAADLAVLDAGGAACPPAQVYVRPACCPPCLFPPQIPDGGCPDGYGVGRCPVGGGFTCVGSCTAPPPYCKTPPPCGNKDLCACLDANTECGPYGGMCIGNGMGGRELLCFGCF